MQVHESSLELARQFLDYYHPLGAGGSLKGQREMLAGYENELPVFLAVFVTPRSRWHNYDVRLELSRLAWTPYAKRSASTFLRQCIRILRRQYDGLIVTYALPGTDGIVYKRAGFYHSGSSSGASWSRRGADSGERPTPDTIGTGHQLKRFFASLDRP